MKSLVVLLSASLLPACSKQDPQPKQPEAKSPSAKVPAEYMAADATTLAKIELGRQLFFDPRLSGSGKTSCSSCHLPDKAWTDGRSVSPKDDGKDNIRNAPTMYNVGSLERLYWDGRATSLEKNIAAAWKAQMSGDPTVVAQRLATVAPYAASAKLAGIPALDEAGIVAAIAGFLRSLQSSNSPFDRWQQGQKDAVSDAAKAGYDLFMGKAGCAVCHMSPMFTDRAFHNTGIGMDKEKPDLGVGGEKAMNDPRVAGYFKTPTLREVAKTAPYFHDGSVAKLEDAVRFMAAGGRTNPTKSPELIDRSLNDAEIAQLVAFLETLTSDHKNEAPKLPQ